MTNLLDLSEDIDRPRVKLHDGNEYEMRVPGDFSIVEQTTIQRHWKAIQRINDGEGELTANEEAVLQRGFFVLMQMLIPDAPEGVRASMSHRAQNKLLEYFQSLAEEKDEGKARGSETSQRSNDSTEAVTR